MTIRVAIVEDDPDIRQSLALLIKGTPGYEPDVVLMDINLPGMSGIECTRLLRDRNPRQQVLILTVYEDSDRIFEALQAGASGYLLKRTSPEQLLQGIIEVRNGGSPMTSEVARKVVQSFRRPARSKAAEEARITPREEEILKLLAQGYVTKEIADTEATSRTSTKNSTSAPGPKRP